MWIKSFHSAVKIYVTKKHFLLQISACVADTSPSMAVQQLKHNPTKLKQLYFPAVLSSHHYVSGQLANIYRIRRFFSISSHTGYSGTCLFPCLLLTMLTHTWQICLWVPFNLCNWSITQLLDFQVLPYRPTVTLLHRLQSQKNSTLLPQNTHHIPYCTAPSPILQLNLTGLIFQGTRKNLNGGINFFLMCEQLSHWMSKRLTSFKST